MTEAEDRIGAKATKATTNIVFILPQSSNKYSEYITRETKLLKYLFVLSFLSKNLIVYKCHTNANVYVNVNANV